MNFKNDSGFWTSLFVLIAMFFILPSAYRVAEDEISQEAEEALAPNEADLRQFFYSKIEPITTALDQGNYPLREIQDMHILVLQKLGEKYSNKIVRRQVSPVYYKNRSDVYSFSFVNEQTGDPTWGFVAPALMDKFAQLKDGQTELVSETFEVFVAIQILHELSKLLYLENGVERTTEHEYLIESFVWADLCESVVSPLIKTHNVAIDDQVFALYFGWTMCGEETNQDWRDYVRGQFEPASK